MASLDAMKQFSRTLAGPLQDRNYIGSIVDKSCVSTWAKPSLGGNIACKSHTYSFSMNDRMNPSEMTKQFIFNRRDFLKLGQVCLFFFASMPLLHSSDLKKITVIRTDKETKDLQTLYFRLSEKTLSIFNKALNRAREEGLLKSRSIHQIDNHTFIILTRWRSQKDFLSTYDNFAIVSQIKNLRDRGIHISFSS
jgi:hypothetical protein